MCQVSHVAYHMSHVMCHFLFFFKVVKLVSGGSVINGPTSSSFIPVYTVLLTFCNLFMAAYILQPNMNLRASRNACKH